jgi:hypothetical protein
VVVNPLNIRCPFMTAPLYQTWIDTLCNDSIPVPVVIPPTPAKSNLGSLSDASNGVALYPNPVVRGSVFDLKYTLARASNVTIEVSDMVGGVVYTSAKEYAAGEAIIPVSTSGWSTGRYMVKVTADGTTFTQRVVVSDK